MPLLKLHGDNLAGDQKLELMHMQLQACMHAVCNCPQCMENCIVTIFPCMQLATNVIDPLIAHACKLNNRIGSNWHAFFFTASVAGSLPTENFFEDIPSCPRNFHAFCMTSFCHSAHCFHHVLVQEVAHMHRI